jgi:glutathione S-transferase
MTATRRLKIYGDSRSGNCYKLQLACAQLGVDYDWQEIDVLQGETRSDGFLAMNPNGKVPVASLPDGRYLSESNAILYYLAAGTDLAGSDVFERANILRWMFFEQYSHEPYIAVARFIVRFLGNPPERRADLEARRTEGYRALDTMERVLSEHPFIANDRYSIADIALYAYTHVAGDGGFSLSGYPRIRKWLRRIEQVDGHVPMLRERG